MTVHQDFEEFIELSEKDDDFLSYKNGNKELFDISKLHFAMNGQWLTNILEFHSITQGSDLVNWFNGLLNHLKMELKFVKEQ